MSFIFVSGPLSNDNYEDLWLCKAQEGAHHGAPLSYRQLEVYPYQVRDQSFAPVIPKSAHKERTQQNFDIFDFKLEDSEMKNINLLDENKTLIVDSSDINVIKWFMKMINYPIGPSNNTKRVISIINETATNLQ